MRTLANKKTRQWFAILLFTAFPLAGWSCEPVIPLVKLLSGSTLIGPAILTQSVWWLLAAVVLKSGVFIYFERRLAWRRAGIYMLLANALSTIPGVLIAGLTGSMVGIVFALPIVLVMGRVVECRFSRLPESQRLRGISAGAITVAFAAFFILSLVIFGCAGDAFGDQSYATYWIFKFFFVTLVACMGIVISAVLEECVIARMTRKSLGEVAFFRSVFRANYITLGVVLLVAAGQMLPRRWLSPHFLVTFLQQLSESFSLT